MLSKTRRPFAAHQEVILMNGLFMVCMCVQYLHNDKENLPHWHCCRQNLFGMLVVIIMCGMYVWLTVPSQEYINLFTFLLLLRLRFTSSKILSYAPPSACVCVHIGWATFLCRRVTKIHTSTRLFALIIYSNFTSWIKILSLCRLLIWRLQEDFLVIPLSHKFKI